MGIIILLSILLAINIFLMILGIVKDDGWDDAAFCLKVFGTAFAIVFLVATVIVGIFQISANVNTSKLQTRAWYEESVENLNSTKEYIATITDDYTRSIAVKDYNKDVKKFKLTIKNAKYDLDNGWINWFTCPEYQYLDETVVDYIR